MFVDRSFKDSEAEGRTHICFYVFVRCEVLFCYVHLTFIFSVRFIICLWVFIVDRSFKDSAGEGWIHIFVFSWVFCFLSFCMFMLFHVFFLIVKVFCLCSLFVVDYLRIIQAMVELTFVVACCVFFSFDLFFAFHLFICFCLCHLLFLFIVLDLRQVI